MKKLLWPLCVITVLLSAAGLGLSFVYLMEELSYDQIAGFDYEIPAQAAYSIGILRQGDHPGMSHEPVTAEQAAPGQAALNALRGQKYTRLLPLSSPADGGIDLRDISGCSIAHIAYWDGKYLWFPGNKEGQWLGYSPSDPDRLGKALESLCKS